MNKEEFNKIRKGPKGRESTFTFETITVRERKINEDEKKTSLRLSRDIFSEVIDRIFDKSQKDVDRLFDLASQIPHFEDLDQKILVVAADLYNRFPGGINVTNQFDQGKLSPELLNSEAIKERILIIVNMNSTSQQNLIGKIDPQKVKADILAYYMLFLR